MRITTTDDLTIEQRELLDAHLQLVLRENEKLNLTRITDWEQGQLLHVEDSIAAAEIIGNAPEGPLADMGSGAGFPGMPLAIMTGRETWLIESIAKKAHSLATMANELNLNDQVHVYTGRVEEASIDMPAKFSVVTARALAPLPALVELSSPLLKIGGLLVCYKAKPEADEIEYAKSTAVKAGMKYVDEIRYMLSDSETSRSIFIYKKEEESAVKLPRRIGMAQKRPIK